MQHMLKYIFWDIDEVMAQIGQHFCTRVEATLGKCKPLHEWTDYRWAQHLGVEGADDPELLRFMNDERLIEDCQPMELIADTLRIACARGYMNVVVSSRAWHRRAFWSTVEWFQKHDMWPYIDGMQIVHHSTNKVSAIQQHLHNMGELDWHARTALFIEDSLNNAIQAAQAGITTALVDCPWNRSLPWREDLPLTRYATAREAVLALPDLLKSPRG